MLASSDVPEWPQPQMKVKLRTGLVRYRPALRPIDMCRPQRSPALAM
jgi:hypothetical protein